MGLRTVARLEAHRRDAIARGKPTEADKALSDQLLAYIPSETLAPTTALFGFFSTDAVSVRAAIVVVAAFLTPVWVWISFVNATTDAKARKAWPVWSMTFGVVSYLIWVGSIPGTPYLKWHVWTLKIGAGLVLVAGFVMYGVSQAHLAWLRRQGAS